MTDEPDYDPDYKPFSTTINGKRYRALYEVSDGCVVVELRYADGAGYGTDLLPKGVSPIAHARKILREMIADPIEFP